MTVADMQKSPEFGVFPVLTKVIMRHFIAQNNHIQLNCLAGVSTYKEAPNLVLRQKSSSSVGD